VLPVNRAAAAPFEFRMEPALSSRALTAADVGRELGRSADWVHANWHKLVAEKKLPPPIIEAGGLTWSAAHVYAFLDRGLPPAQRATAAAYRAALAAALTAPGDLTELDDIEQSRQRLALRRASRG
jgi:hypothetical protein